MHSVREPAKQAVKASTQLAASNPTHLSDKEPGKHSVDKDDKEKKKHRGVSSFTTNKTASLALQEEPKKALKEEPKKPQEKQNTPDSCMTTPNTTEQTKSFSMQSIINSLASLTLNNKKSADNKKSTAPDKIKECKYHLRTDPPQRNTPAQLAVQLTSHDKTAKTTKSEQDKDISSLEKILSQEDRIIEHAARRADLFFYLLIAVYGKQLIISKDSTVKQHGKGNKAKGTQACHSSLFPNIRFSHPSKDKITQADKTQADKEEKVDLIDLKGTHLLESLNMTVELPKVVNDFDGRLEGRSKPTKFTTGCIDILNQASKKELDPKTGMSAYIKKMNEFFIHFENKYIIKNRKITSPLSKKKIWELEKTGTMMIADKDLNICDKYVHMMLRLKPDEIQQTADPKKMDVFYKRIQDEIFTSVPVKRNKR